MTKAKRTKSIVFFHPDLGVGGAERLIVDAAIGLQKRGHKVTIFTSHCDPGHCFDEVRDGILDVRVRGNTLVPPSISSRFSVLCAVLRQLHLIISITILSNELYDVAPSAFFVDQLSACAPLLRFLCPSVPLLFYCHFPDKLLADRQQWWRRLYRIPFDWLEGWSTGSASVIVVNSLFTRSVVRKAFPGLAKNEQDLQVVYPCVDVGVASKKEGLTTARSDDTASSKSSTHTTQETDKGPWKDGKKLLLSINRFERTKNIELAIRAFAGLDQRQRSKSRLVLAGGYDSRLPAQTAYYKSLVDLAESLDLRTATASNPITALSPPIAEAEVVFLLSISSSLKRTLLDHATLLLYTPPWEHFGIVPLEAMMARVPVLAANTGGPKESVVDEETGWLRDTKDTSAWTNVLQKATDRLTPQELLYIGRAGAERVKGHFSRDMMALRFEEVISSTKAGGPNTVLILGGLFLMLASGMVLTGFLALWITKYLQ